MTIFIITLDLDDPAHWEACGPPHDSLQAARSTTQYDGSRNKLAKTMWSEQSREQTPGGIFNRATQQPEAPAWIVELSQ